MPDSGTAEQLRLEIDDAFPKMALAINAILQEGSQVIQLQKLLFRPITLKPSSSATQIHNALAHIGMAYMQAVVQARDERLKQKGADSGASSGSE